MIIIWDFNGTLINDMQVCIDCMNRMLSERRLPGLNLDKYRDIFTFPVKEYYLSLGFDFSKEPFEIPAHQFIDLYRENLHNAPLHDDTEDLLSYFRSKNYRQFILSAMEQDFLEETLKMKNIHGYFERICGITNHLGEGKLEMAKELMSGLNGSGRDFVMIGDTLHDYEVAQGLGVPCVLIANGHQSHSRLQSLDCLIVDEMKQLKDHF